MFHKAIWDMSLTAFDKPREVQVVIDGNDNLFISVGTPGFVSFGGQNEQTHGMKFPLKEWIHTHPFGRAYFSMRSEKEPSATPISATVASCAKVELEIRVHCVIAYHGRQTARLTFTKQWAV